MYDFGSFHLFNELTFLQSEYFYNNCQPKQS